MKTTTYKCDRCGATDTDEAKLGLRDVGVGITDVSYGAFSHRDNGFTVSDPCRRRAEWCSKCLLEFGLVWPKNGDGITQPTVVPTLEEMIREIVREEMGSS